MAPTRYENILISIDTVHNDAGFRRFDANATRLEQWVNRLRQNILLISNSFAIAGGILASGLFAVTRQMYTFELALNRVAAVSRASTEEMEQFENQARQLGATTEFSASQAAGAQVAFAQAGFSVNETLNATPGILSLAAAGQLEMAEATAIAAKSVRQFNLDASETNRVADVLAEVSARSLTDVQKMGRALAFSGVAADTLNVSIERTSAALGVLQNAGITGFRAGTNLRALFSRMAGPTNIAAKEIERLGFNVDEFSKRVQEGQFVEVLEELGEAGLDFVSARKIFEQEVAPAAIILSKGGDEVRELTKQLENAEGAAEAMAKRTNQGLVGAFRRLRSVTEELLISLGRTGIVQAMTGAANSAAWLIRVVAGLPGPIRFVMSLLLLAGPVLLGLAAASRALAFYLQFINVALTRNAVLWLLDTLFLKQNAVARGLLSSSMYNWLAAQRGALAATAQSTTATNANTGATNANTGATAGNTGATNANSGARTFNTRTQFINSSALFTNTGARNFNTQSQFINSSALFTNTGATAGNTAATNANTVSLWAALGATIKSAAASTVLTFVRIKQAVVTKAAAVAQWALNAAMLANPIGASIAIILLMIGALTGLTLAFHKLTRATRDFNDETERINQPFTTNNRITRSGSLYRPGTQFRYEDRYLSPERASQLARAESSLNRPTTTVNQNTRLNVDRIAIDASGADSTELATNIRQALQEEFNSAERQGDVSNVVL